jgi:D-glycero-D-manno-heptose 1,7-bisphosphate phosphatase/D-glycero-alpha-D-manno-heptose 1-phosphate guanylyltransferase
VPLSLERDLLPGWVADRRVYGYRSPCRFLDIGTPESYAGAPAFFAGCAPGGIDRREATAL